MGTPNRTHRRRRPQERRAEGGRRLHSAGSAVVVALGALVLGSFLNAAGIHKSAAIQSQGWKRDVALDVTGPLQSVSDSLLLDRPRRALKAVLGRSDDDAIDTAVAVPKTPPVEPKPSDTTAPKRTRFSPSHPLRLWIAGDSLVIVPGESLLRAVAGNRAIESPSKVDGRIASGLERPDVFNWFTYVKEQMRTRKPGAVVLMFGGNDDHDFMTGLPEGTQIGSFGSASWTAEYRRRVRAIMDFVTRSGAYLVWIGLPISHDAGQTARFDAINAIVQKEAAKRPGRVTYIDTYFFFAGDDGGYAEYIQDSAGRLVKMRADDGVHFERPAGDLIARAVLHRLNQRFDITSWRQSASG
jgi:hypothetical protein